METRRVAPSSGVQLFSRQFDDVDEVRQLVQRQREARVIPLSSGSFQGTLHQVDFGNLFFSFPEIQTPVQVLGERRSGFISFGVPLQFGVRPSYVHQEVVDTNTLCGFDVTRGLDSIYHQNFVLAEMQVRQDLFESTLSAMRRDDITPNLLKKELIHLPTTLSVYRRYMQNVMQLVKQRSPLLFRPDYRQLILDDVLPLLIDAIPRRKSNLCLPPHPRQRAQLVRLATEYIETHIHDPLTLKDLYTALGVSRRTLFYSFEYVFGVTPMEYIKVQRLQGAWRSLKQADPRTAQVTAIAHQWGFCHLGQFAKAYQAMFNELPSQTLRRSH